MTTSATTSAPTFAAKCAAQNFRTNSAAILMSQPDLAKNIQAIEIDLEWLWGRDGSLTARTLEAKWLSKTALPRRVAEAQLKDLKLSGPVACFIAPPHAAAIRVVLDRGTAEQAIIAIVPDVETFAAILHCEDFAYDISFGRVWFVVGEVWQSSLNGLFDQQPGLSLPTQFVRLDTADATTVETIVREAQKIFGEVVQRRTTAAATIRGVWVKAATVQKICAIAPRGFRLWNDWGDLLRRSISDDADIDWIDTDDPRSMSPLAIAQAATGCDALLSINLARVDAPNLLPDNMPWMTWCVNGRIPSPIATSPLDRLIVLDGIDQSRAIEGGWSRASVVIAAPRADRPEIAGGRLTVIADTCSLEVPERVDNFSSQRPLWESIASELTASPLSLVDVEIDDYLASRAKRFNVSWTTLDLALFIDSLIVPAFQQGVVRLLAAEKIAVDLFGRGWESFASANILVCGEVGDRESFQSVLNVPRTLLHVWPSKRTHAMELNGVRVVRPMRDRLAFLRQLARESASGGQLQITAMKRRGLTASFIHSLFN